MMTLKNTTKIITSAGMIFYATTLFAGECTDECSESFENLVGQCGTFWGVESDETGEIKDKEAEAALMKCKGRFPEFPFTEEEFKAVPAAKLREMCKSLCVPTDLPKLNPVSGEINGIKLFDKISVKLERESGKQKTLDFDSRRPIPSPSDEFLKLGYKITGVDITTRVGKVSCDVSEVSSKFLERSDAVIITTTQIEKINDMNIAKSCKVSFKK